jgi:hypothetical protein
MTMLTFDGSVGRTGSPGSGYHWANVGFARTWPTPAPSVNKPISRRLTIALLQSRFLRQSLPGPTEY